MIKTFRGLLADGGQDRIRLSTIKGKVGYRIVKFQVLTGSPADTAPESIVQIWKTEQTTVTAKINFTDSDLLAAAFYNQDATAANIVSQVIIFDTEIFNQDIYIAHIDDNTGSTTNCNYYIELEVIPLDDKAAEYTILKDIRTHGTSAI